MAVNRAVSSHDGRMGLTRAGVHAAGANDIAGKVDEADHSARIRETPSLICRCNIGEMPRKVPVKCAIAGCHRRLKMTLAEREELRRVDARTTLQLGFGEQGPGVERGANGVPLANAEAGNGLEGRK